MDFEAYYKVDGYNGIAWFIMGNPMIKYGDDFDSDEFDESKVCAVMVGDDREFIFDVEDLTEIDEGDFCNSCGQIGCGH